MPKPCTHTYHGPAFPTTPSAHAGVIVDADANPVRLTGSFRVVTKSPGRLVLGNGESPNEQFWIVCVPERVELKEAA